MTYEIRPMSFGEILDMGFRILRNHFTVLVGLAAVVYLPLLFLQMAFHGLLPQGGATVPDDVRAALPLLGGGVLLILLWLVLAMPVTSAAVTHAVGELYLGRPVSIGASLRVGWSMLLPLAGTTMLMFLIVGAGLLLLIIPGVYLALCYALVWPVMVLEGVFGMAALNRSRTLVRGSLLRVLGLLVVVGVLVSVVGGAAALAVGYIPVLGDVASTFINATGTAFSAAASVVLYFDQRCRKEAFDLEHLARLVEVRAGGTLPAPQAG